MELPIHAADYTRYVLGESGVEAAIREGMPEEEAKAFCEEHFEPLFARGLRMVCFEVVLAIARRVSPAAR